MKNAESTVFRLSEDYSYEQLAAALYSKGLRDGYPKITDKTKWRELVVADKLGHIPHKKISAGVGADEYGSDAYDPVNKIYAEYKTKTVEEEELRNLFELPKGKKGKTFSPLRVRGIYNGAYTNEAIDKYQYIDHYFALFYREECVLIIKPHTKELIAELRRFNDARKPEQTKNCNSYEVNLGDKYSYEVAYKKDEFFGRFT